MTSEERKAGRRERREKSRTAKRQELNREYDNYDNVVKSSALFKAALFSRKTVRWKASVQKFCAGLLRNIWGLHKDLVDLKDITQGFIEFVIRDRGKERTIRSVHFRERVVQRSVSDNALIPVLGRSLIYDNGASLKGRGIHFHLKRCKQHLQEFYRKNGCSNDGFVLLIDFTGYFDNVEHGPLIAAIKRFFRDVRLIALIIRFIERFGDKSLGIGSQVSQILAVFYASPADHFAKEVLRLLYYGRYMDDTYIIHEDRAVLEDALRQLIKIYDLLGIRVNMKKTHIASVKHFVFLKVRFSLTETGAVIMRPTQEKITRERRKMKAHKRMIDAGEMTIADARSSYASYAGYLRHLNAHKTLRSTDQLYHSLFGVWPPKPKKKKKRRGKQTCGTTPTRGPALLGQTRTT